MGRALVGLVVALVAACGRAHGREPLQDAGMNDDAAAPSHDVCSDDAFARVTVVASERTTGSGFSRIALDEHDVFIDTGQAVKRVGKCGGQVTTLVEHGAGGFDLFVDDEFMYWTQPSGDDGKIVKASKDNGALTILASGLRYPWSVYADERDVYWSDIGSSSYPRVPGGIYATPIGGGDIRTVATDFYNCRSLQVDAERLYCQTYNQSGSPVAIVSIDKRDGARRVVVPGEAGVELSLGGEELYYVTLVSGRSVLRRVSKHGGTPTTLYETQSTPELGDVVGTSTGVYVLDQGIGAGRVRRVPLDGGPPELIAEAEWHEVGRNLAVDDRSVYWVEARSSCTRRRPASGDVGPMCVETTTESRLMRAPR